MTLNDFADLSSTVGIFFVAAGLMISIRQFKYSRTMDYMGHLSDPSMVETRTKVDEWIASSDDDAARIQVIEKDHELHTHIRIFLSWCNQISIAYRFGAINKEMAFDIWSAFAPHYWDRLQFYIQWRRDNGYNTGHNFESFVKDMRIFNRKRSDKLPRQSAAN